MKLGIVIRCGVHDSSQNLTKPCFSKGFIRKFFNFGYCGMALSVLYRISFPECDLRMVKYSDMVVDYFYFL